MKKRIINKSTLLLAVLAVACWCFYFWQAKENQEFIEETQGIVIDFNEKNKNIKSSKNQDFISRTESSWLDSIGFMRNYPKSPIKEIFYRNISAEYNNYLQSIYDFEGEFFYERRYNDSFKYNNAYRKKCLLEIEKQFQRLIKYPNFTKADFTKVNWKETDDETIWFDLIQQRSEVIQIVDSILKKNKKQFPTSYASNSFEGYSTFIPNNETQTMLIKVYWFPSDTKYYSDYGEKNKMGIVPINFQFQGSTYDPFNNPKLFYTFHKVGDTTVYPMLEEIDEVEEENFSIRFTVISKQNSNEK